MQIIDDRRALHRIPELDRDLPETMEYLRRALAGLNCRVFAPMNGALCAFFDFGKPESIAFRADCDALPITEASGVCFASTHPGKMHACGHDGHMAILLELARRLSEKKDLPHNVLLVFQPAEETTGGAKDLCGTGIFAAHHVKAIFGLHLWPGLERGRVFSRRNELMARASEVTADIFGRSSHIAKASEGIDALAAGVEFYRRTRELEKGLPQGVFRLLNFGKFQSGAARNAISAHTHLEGCLRTFQDEVFEGLRAGLFAIAADLEAETGCRVELRFSEGYPAVMNPPELYDRAAKAAAFEPLAKPSMTAEDFSWYQRYLPGLFFFLGLGDTPPLHAADFDFDDEILVKGADFFLELAEHDL